MGCLAMVSWPGAIVPAGGCILQHFFSGLQVNAYMRHGRFLMANVLVASNDQLHGMTPHERSEPCC
jgi:hypothetical protein